MVVEFLITEPFEATHLSITVIGHVEHLPWSILSMLRRLL
jgi:hypothetical protein